MRKFSALMLAVLGATAVMGCSTPAAVTKQAEHGVALTSELDLELKAFRKHEANSEKFLLDAVAYQKKQVVALNKAIASENLAADATGDPTMKRISGTMAIYLQQLAKLDQAQQADLAGATNSLTSVLAPLPSTTEALTDTQTKFADFGKELPISTRAKEFKQVADAVKKVVDENKKKMADAAASASSSPAN